MNLTVVDMCYALRMTELNCPVVRGDPSLLTPHVAAWLQECVALCQPERVHLMDGSPQEDRELKVQRLLLACTTMPACRRCW